MGPEVGGGQVESHYHTIMLPFHRHPHPCKIATTRYKIQNIDWNHFTIPFHQISGTPNTWVKIPNTPVKIPKESHHSTLNPHPWMYFLVFKFLLKFSRIMPLQVLLFGLYQDKQKVEMSRPSLSVGISNNVTLFGLKSEVKQLWCKHKIAWRENFIKLKVCRFTFGWHQNGYTLSLSWQILCTIIFYSNSFYSRHQHLNILFKRNIRAVSLWNTFFVVH